MSTSVVRRGSARLSRAQSNLSFAALGSLAASASGTAVRFGVQIMLARWLGITAYGSFVVARGWGELLAKFPNRGYPLTIVRHLPAYALDGDYGRYRGLLRASFRESLALAVALAATAALVATAFGAASPAYLIGLGLIPLLAVQVLSQATLQTLHRLPTSALVVEVLQPICLAICVALLVALRWTGAAQASGAYVVSITIAVVVLSAMRRRAQPMEVGSHDAISDRATWLKAARPFYVAQLSIASLGTSDLLVVGAILGDRAAGTFAAAFRIAALSQLIDSGVESAAGAHLSAAWASGDRHRVQQIVDQCIRLAAPLTIAVMLVAIPLGGPLLSLLGEEYAGGRWVLTLLLAGYAVNAINGPAGFVVSMSGNERRYAAVMAGHALAAIALSSAAAAVGNVNTVALAALVVTLSWNLWLVGVARSLGVRCYPRLRRSKRTRTVTDDQ